MLSDLFPAKRLTFALSIYSIGALMGSAVSLAVGATVVRGLEHGLTLPVLGHLHSWQAAFLATGVPGTGTAAFTVIFTTAVAFTPALSVTVNWKVYTPCSIPFTAV